MLSAIKEDHNMFQGKLKAITFSYDDGVTQDQRLIAMLNHYGHLQPEFRPAGQTRLPCAGGRDRGPCEAPALRGQQHLPGP